MPETGPPSFGEIAFRGQFRPYQAALLDQVEGHLVDGRIHVVAAPGSGKTVLGLELIRYLGAGALVISPTLVISQQWGERLADMFLPPGADLGRYVSHDLRQPGLITSVTYQAVHAAYRRLAPGGAQAGEPAEEDLPDAAPGLSEQPPAGQVAGAEPDYTAFDLVSTLRDKGITTICLDEAHHLRREWHKALTSLLQQLGSTVQIISLTATPPYDADSGEWERYVQLCGPIDEEIFVPQLVADGTLCPHQDYIYFTTPTAEDKKILAAHKANTRAFLEELAGGSILKQAIQSCLSALQRSASRQELPEVDVLYEQADGALALVVLARWAGVAVPDELAQALAGGLKEPRLTMAVAAQAAEFMVDPDNAVLFGSLGQAVAELGRRHRVYHMREFQLVRSLELDRLLTNSLGKLTAIEQIATAEAAALGSGLRLVVLTDYIRADHLNVVGAPGEAPKPITAIGVVPVFEVLRRALPAGLDVGLVSGSLVVWPQARLEPLLAAAAAQGVEVSCTPLGQTGYVRVNFAGSNRAKVAVVTAAFEQGAVNALVGTCALLGEGWDSPCVNTLIMASFVGSFVL
ncbi:MAG: DEAD/DEAH box helicase family protein, partial [Bifidobacteriaceae bacterium]|nr:DEAD/DEAH box helicase family protein [Bifidobacteriaceae bacterium]